MKRKQISGDSEVCVRAVRFSNLCEEFNYKREAY